jgi:hypothetical protein
VDGNIQRINKIQINHVLGGIDVTQSQTALSILYEQVVVELVGNPKPANIRCYLIQDWMINHNSGVLEVSGSAVDSAPPSTPPWIDYNFNPESEQFTLQFEVEPYLHDGIGLILQTWRNHQHNPKESFEFHLRGALLAISKRWKLQSDPLAENDQRGLIGELRCVLAGYHTSGIGIEAIESWDPTGDQLYDIDSDNWVIECKASGSEPEVVRISYPEQVDYTIEKTLVLGVTKVNKDKKNGVTLPNIINMLLGEHKPMPAPHLSKLNSVLAGRKYSIAMAEKYTTKWKVGKTRYLHITSDSNVMPCSILEGLPATVRNIKYSLNTSQFPESELFSLIGG